MLLRIHHVRHSIRVETTRRFEEEMAETSGGRLKRRQCGSGLGCCEVSGAVSDVDEAGGALADEKGDGEASVECQISYACVHSLYRGCEGAGSDQKCRLEQLLFEEFRGQQELNSGRNREKPASRRGGSV